MKKAMTWDELAGLYDAHNGGRRARTLPMEIIVEWAQRRPDLVYVHPKNDTFHKVTEKRHAT